MFASMPDTRNCMKVLTLALAVVLNLSPARGDALQGDKDTTKTLQQKQTASLKAQNEEITPLTLIGRLNETQCVEILDQWSGGKAGAVIERYKGDAGMIVNECRALIIHN